MELKKKLGLVCFAYQPGATQETFCEATFRAQVEAPIRALLAVEGLVQKIVVVSKYSDTWSSTAEKSCAEYVREGGTPKQTFTPTSVAVLKHLMDEYQNGRVDYHNVVEFWGVPSALRSAETDIRGHGAQIVVVKVSEKSFPSEEELVSLREAMEATGRDYAILGAEFAPRELLGDFAPREFTCV